MRAGTWHAAAQDLGGRDGNFKWEPLSKDLNSLRNGTYKSTTIREVAVVGVAPEGFTAFPPYLDSSLASPFHGSPS